jgi:hypothetical protein
MSEQPATKGRVRGTSRAGQAAAGVAGALAFLGIGWVTGARAAAPPASTPATTGPTSGIQAVPLPGGWDDDGPQTQWGTIPLPGTLSPAQPGIGGAVPPATGSGGSSVAGASLTTTNVTAGTNTAAATGTAP